MYFDAVEGTFVNEDGEEVRVDVEDEEEEELEDEEEEEGEGNETPAVSGIRGAHTITSRSYGMYSSLGKVFELTNMRVCSLTATNNATS